MLKNLKLLRDKRGISQKTLALAIGVSQQSINKYENHNIEPDINTLILIADYFNTSLDYVVGHIGIKGRDGTQMCELNADELRLIERYRGLNENQQKALCMVAESYE